jgi:hypothetical protein
MPARKDLTLWKGNTFLLPIVFKQKDSAGNLLPIDLTGSVLVFRATWDGGAFRADSTGDSFTITDAAAGAAQLLLSVEQSRLFPAADTYVRYEIERHSGLEQKSWLYGEIKIWDWANDD